MLGPQHVRADLLPDGTPNDYPLTIRARPALRTMGGGAYEALGGVATVTAGEAHTCAMAASGQSYCWGANDHGQVSDAPGGPQYVAYETSGRWPALLGLSAGGDTTCALVREASEANLVTVRCAGANTTGQSGGSPLGWDTYPPTNVLVPANYLLGDTQVRVSTGKRFSCALSFNGGAHCWGANDLGQLGRSFSGADDRYAEGVVDLF